MEISIGRGSVRENSVHVEYVEMSCHDHGTVILSCEEVLAFILPSSSFETKWLK